ncbi:serine/threonine-protein kinase [Nonomuraea zeae]|uniref:Serine/threonine protein kinase n=1 Tax=Nonomuraea zeae TaxID=1642303 RepID=A0A5S4GT33_9ACTN|nr:serine/threonine-protein kinase [Nonomuraea zeae]TMR36105.1 serine/threonine protein kinase [Nonomuraea zeae]
MLEPAETRPDDPAAIAGYRLIGRLGEGGQGTVYLAVTADGSRVALKLLRADLAGDTAAAQRFVREVALARRVAPFCTAQVLDTGLDGGRPYIVSEYVSGSTLAEVVRDEGPRTGASLHRLAIGTVTALAAIHQAGIVHRDFKPSNVLLAADGPRVIDFGVARALDLTSTLTGGVIGTPAFMAPEQFGQVAPGPPADMFAWAGTMLYAASGRYPFGHDHLPAVIGRILTAEPDAGHVEDPALRALVTDCLAKDPARRPTAGEALTRLLGMPPGAGTPAAGMFGRGSGATGPTPAARFRWAFPRMATRKATVWIAATAVTTALALTALALALGTPSATPSGAASSTPSAAPKEPTATATFAQPTRSFSVPSTTMRVYEDANDPIKLASYYGGNGVYIRQQGSQTFKRDKSYSHPYVPSPDGTRALVLNNYNPDNGPKNVSIIDRSTGAKKTVTVSARRGVWAYAPRWSADGKYGLVTLSLPAASGDAWTRAGYAIVDIEQATAREVEVEDAPAALLRFFWVGTSVGMWADDGTIRLYDLSGAYLRSLENAHAPGQMDDDPVSPDGTRFVARCSAEGTDLCVRPVSRGGTAVTVPFTGTRLIGWWDDGHLVVWRPKGQGYEIVVVDLSGEQVRLLATTTDKTQGLFHFTRAAI